MPGKAVQDCAAGNIPEQDEVIFTAGNHRLTVWTDGDTGDTGGMPGKTTHRFSRLKTPEDERAVVGGGHNALFIGCVGDTPDFARMTVALCAKANEGIAGLSIPEGDNSILTA